jgi:Na+-transporting NADH:ubiquinone oxidoreductase subunit C
LLYSTILVVATAVILSLAVFVLQPYQEDNVKIEKMQYILNAAGIENNAKNAAELYKRHINNEIEIECGGATHCIQKLYICKNDDDTLTIVPISGKGLWGPVWGYIAFEKDLNTIHGAVFDHKGETPGLGAEIAEKKFQNEFIGKKIFDRRDNFVSVSVLKPNEKTAAEINRVDALSGSTLTSKGLSAAIKESLKMYERYFEEHRDGKSYVLNQEVQNDSMILQPCTSVACNTSTTPVIPATLPKPMTRHSAPFYPYKTVKKTDTIVSGTTNDTLVNQP